MTCRRASRALRLPLFFLLAFAPAAYAASSGDGRATIRRDSFGVPHILAATEEAAAFAHGYATAEDHQAALARLFLRARGEQASVFGPDFLAEDVRTHQLGIWETAHDRYDELPPYMQAIFEGYAAGYNLYLERHRQEAPAWSRPVSGVDVLAHCRAVLLMDFALDLRSWNNSGPASGAGSNMWAVGRERSRSGHAMLLVNPHLRWEGSQVFHEVHISVPGVINIYGATLIGFPAVTMGFNEYLGWAHTVNQHRSDDVYQLALDPADPSKYFYDGRRLALKTRTFTVTVKTAGGSEVRSFEDVRSHYGPVIRREGNKAWTFKSPNLDLVNFVTEYNQMSKARDFSSFQAALNMQQLPMFNLGYADRDGNIYFVSNGRIPIRPVGRDWSQPSAPAGSATEWLAVHPLSELPHLFNPPGGYVQNCNDAPWYANLRGGIDKSQFPAYLAVDGLGPRGQTSLRMLEADSSLTLDKIKRLKYDETVPSAPRLKEELIALARERGGELRESAAALESWDNTASRASRGAVLFLRWWEEYSRGPGPVWKQAWSPANPLDTPAGLADPARALAALARVNAALKSQSGSAAVPWGSVFRMRRQNFDLPIGGTNGALRTIVYRKETGGTYTAVGGDSFVLAVEFTDPPTAYAVTAYSESSNPRSKHYADQTAVFADEEYRPVRFTEADILNHLERAYTPAEEPVTASARVRR